MTLRIRTLQDRAAELRWQAISAGLLRLSELVVVVDPSVHDNDRHFAMCSERVDEIRVAPQLADQPAAIVDGILMHELGHAVDFAYPAETYIYEDEGRRVLGLSPTPPRRSFSSYRGARKIWKARTPYRVETDADRIAEALFGVRIGYVGPLMLQSTDGGVRPRPFGI